MNFYERARFQKVCDLIRTQDLRRGREIPIINGEDDDGNINRAYRLAVSKEEERIFFVCYGHVWILEVESKNEQGDFCLARVNLYTDGKKETKLDFLGISYVEKKDFTPNWMRSVILAESGLQSVYKNPVMKKYDVTLMRTMLEYATIEMEATSLIDAETDACQGHSDEDLLEMPWIQHSSKVQVSSVQESSNNSLPPDEDCRAVLKAIQDALWPNGNRDEKWTFETLEKVASLLAIEGL